MSNYVYIVLVPLLPLASFFLLGLFGRKYFKTSAGVIATGILLISTVLSFYIAYQYYFVDGKVDGVYRQIVALKYTWLEFYPGISIDMNIILDPISIMMIVVVSFISLMVHVFSLGYMKGEERFSTYYSFLSLFTFSMLGLVLSGNILQIYIFWELVGVSSYLLIGYYFEKPSAVAASLADRVTRPRMPCSTVIVPPARTPSLVGAWAAAWAEKGTGVSRRMRPCSNASKVMYRVIILVREAGYCSRSAFSL